MADTIVELHKAVRDAGEKYVYFLLAAAGAAIAFAITQTQTALLTQSKIPLGLAVVSWGLSFYYGCRQTAQTNAILHANYQYLRAQAGNHPQLPPDPEVLEIFSQTLEQLADKSGRYVRWQFRFLILGAVFYIGWHVLEMYIRTPH